VSSRLDRPRTRLECVAGWVVSAIAFLAIVALHGGPSPGDATETQFATWAMAHGEFACSYVSQRGNVQAGPLYDLLSAPLTLLFHVGGSVPFPARAAFGPNCSRLGPAIGSWWVAAGPEVSTIRIGYFVWLVVAIGVVLVLRASGRGRTGWEIVAVAAVACTPPVFMCLSEYFHPEDLLSMGLLLCGTAACMRGRWGRGGALIGLAIAAQVFALLVLLPLLVLAPRASRYRFATTAAVAVALVCIPLEILTSGRLLDALTGASVTLPHGTAVVGHLDLRGTALVVVSRLTPLLLACCLAAWARARLGPRVLEPQPLLAVLGLSLALRLAFEVNLYSYYFMATAVVLVLLDVLARRIRLGTVAWIVAVTYAFDTKWLPTAIQNDIPISASQVVLVLAGMALTATPLVKAVREERSGAREAPRHQLQHA
jgi:hypothetical protein